MTTVEDKVKLFARIILEKVESSSEQRVVEFAAHSNRELEQEKRIVLKESENMINQMKRRAEAKKRQIMSKAQIDSQHALLKKRQDLFELLVSDIRKMAEDFIMQPSYTGFLEKSIKNALMQIEASQIMLLFRGQDILRFKDEINRAVDKYKKSGAKVKIEETDRDIIGGCICEDSDRTMRVDCSMASLIDDNRGLIGKVLVDNLQ